MLVANAFNNEHHYLEELADRLKNQYCVRSWSKHCYWRVVLLDLEIGSGKDIVDSCQIRKYDGGMLCTYFGLNDM